ncbi:hypothetical protein H632_c4698p0, partial [Helicosporidium sp. ATCC 50920]
APSPGGRPGGRGRRRRLPRAPQRGAARPGSRRAHEVGGAAPRARPGGVHGRRGLLAAGLPLRLCRRRARGSGRLRAPGRRARGDGRRGAAEGDASDRQCRRLFLGGSDRQCRPCRGSLLLPRLGARHLHVLHRSHGLHGPRLRRVRTLAVARASPVRPGRSRCPVLWTAGALGDCLSARSPCGRHLGRAPLLCR